MLLSHNNLFAIGCRLLVFNRRLATQHSTLVDYVGLVCSDHTKEKEISPPSTAHPTVGEVVRG